MRKLSCCILILLYAVVQIVVVHSVAAAAADSPLYGITVTTIEGEHESLSQFAGKVLLIVNTASRCGFTPQYRDLQELYKKYRDRGVVVLGFPSNDFGGQEPGTNAQVRQFCQLRYGVEFPLFEKGKVTGPEKQPVFQYLTDSKGDLDGEVSWNFEKFLVDRNGKLRARFGSQVNPLNGRITAQLEKLADEK